FVENTHRRGSFEDAISIVDAIEKIQSSAVNEVEYFDNAYMAVKGMSVEQEDIADMKNNRVLVVDGDGDVSFITKDVNDGYIQNMLDRLTNDFHKLTATPNLTDENFSSNSSGVAMQYKLFGLEKQINKKEAKWRKSLQRMIELIVEILNMRGSNIDYRNYKITFTRALPQNVAEIAQMATSLNGLVSQETLLSLLPFVENPQDELKKANDEKMASFESFSFPLADSEPVEEGE
ncbi:phage portal protein, partial [Turicibacter sanguinis]